MAESKAKTAEKKVDNMRLWNKVSKTNPKDTKGFKGKGGFSGTAICAQSQRRNATAALGIYGIDWAVMEEKYEIILLDPADPHSAKLFYTATFRFTYEGAEGKFPIASEIDMWMYSKTYKNWAMGNDLYKKVRTDAMTKGLSELGFNSDIFEGKYDDSKYVNELRGEFNENSKGQDSPSALASGNSPTGTAGNNAPSGSNSKAAPPKSAQKAEAPVQKAEGGSPELFGAGDGDRGGAFEFPDFDPANVDSMFKAAVAVANHPADFKINPKHIPLIMQPAIAIKGTGDVAAMAYYIGDLKAYIDETEEVRNEKIKNLGVM